MGTEQNISFLDWLDESDTHWRGPAANSPQPVVPVGDSLWARMSVPFGYQPRQPTTTPQQHAVVQATTPDDWQQMEQQMICLLQQQIADLATHIDTSPSPPTSAAPHLQLSGGESVHPNQQQEFASQQPVPTERIAPHAAIGQGAALEYKAEGQVLAKMTPHVQEGTQPVTLENMASKLLTNEQTERDSKSGSNEWHCALSALEDQNYDSKELRLELKRMSKQLAESEQQQRELRGQMGLAKEAHKKGRTQAVQAMQQLVICVEEWNDELRQQAARALAEHEKLMADAADKAKKQIQELIGQNQELKLQMAIAYKESMAVAAHDAAMTALVHDEAAAAHNEAIVAAAHKSTRVNERLKTCNEQLTKETAELKKQNRESEAERHALGLKVKDTAALLEDLEVEHQQLRKQAEEWEAEWEEALRVSKICY